LKSWDVRVVERSCVTTGPGKNETGFSCKNFHKGEKDGQLWAGK